MESFPHFAKQPKVRKRGSTKDFEVRVKNHGENMDLKASCFPNRSWRSMPTPEIPVRGRDGSGIVRPNGWQSHDKVDMPPHFLWLEKMLLYFPHVAANSFSRTRKTVSISKEVVFSFDDVVKICHDSDVSSASHRLAGNAPGPSRRWRKLASTLRVGACRTLEFVLRSFWTFLAVTCYDILAPGSKIWLCSSRGHVVLGVTNPCVTMCLQHFCTSANKNCWYLHVFTMFFWSQMQKRAKRRCLHGFRRPPLKILIFAVFCQTWAENIAFSGTRQ